MVLTEDVEQIKSELAQELGEDAHNLRRLSAFLEQLEGQDALGPYSALLLALTGLSFDEEEAVLHWKAIRSNRGELTARLGRPVGLRIALLDHFVHQNHNSTSPHWIEVSLTPSAARTDGTDPVTGLLDTEALGKHLHREVQRARRFRTGFSVLLVQIDDYFAILERAGSINAGFVQREVGLLLSNAVRDIDPAARIGPGTFGVVLPETDRTGAFLVAERLRRRVKDHFASRSFGGRRLGVTVSGGIASFPEDAGFGVELMDRGEQALHQARARGRDRISAHFRERREYFRITPDSGELQVQLVERGQPLGGVNGGAPAQNISAQGVLLRSSRAYPLGQPVSVICNNLRDVDQVVVQGRIVRVEELDGASADVSFEVGVAFEHQLDEVLEFLERFGEPQS
jgi:diguanylate cyclase (GGDEF)-like protein